MLSKFIEVQSNDKRWVINVKQIQCVAETYERNAKVYFGEEDALILDQISEVEEI